MDQILLKRTAIQSVSLMLAVVTLSFALRQNVIVKISANLHNAEAAETSTKQMQEVTITGASSEEMAINQPALQADTITETQVPEDSTGLQGSFPGINSDITSQLGERYLVIKKPKAKNLNFALEDLYMSKSIRVYITGSEDTMDSNFIGRINKEYAFIGEPEFIEVESQETGDDGSTIVVITKDYGMDIVHGITINSSLMEGSGRYKTDLQIELDNIYAHIIREDDSYYYIGLKKPSEVYERILVIDAGHGGKDAGALSSDKLTYEKNINLQILLSLKELLDKEDIKVYYTRLMDDKVFLRPRVQLANAVDCDFFISIHCNASVPKSPSGTEILYYDSVYKNVSNKKLASILSDELDASTTLKNRGLVKRQKDDIFILENAIVPAVIIETGYMTDKNDLNYLSKDENQKTIAQGIFNGILRAYDELEPE